MWPFRRPSQISSKSFNKIAEKRTSSVQRSRFSTDVLFHRGTLKYGRDTFHLKSKPNTRNNDAAFNQVSISTGKAAGNLKSNVVVAKEANILAGRKGSHHHNRSRMTKDLDMSEALHAQDTTHIGSLTSENHSKI